MLLPLPLAVSEFEGGGEPLPFALAKDVREIARDGEVEAHAEGEPEGVTDTVDVAS